MLDDSRKEVKVLLRNISHIQGVYGFVILFSKGDEQDIGTLYRWPDERLTKWNKQQITIHTSISLILHTIDPNDLWSYICSRD